LLLKAIEKFEESLSYNVTNSNALSQLAETLVTFYQTCRKNPALLRRAHVCYTSAIQLENKNPTLLFKYAALLALEEDWRRAELFFLESLEIDPT
jgi:tetratricopeptide (TPR) repeat protein